MVEVESTQKVTCQLVYQKQDWSRGRCDLLQRTETEEFAAPFISPPRRFGTADGHVSDMTMSSDSSSTPAM